MSRSYFRSYPVSPECFRSFPSPILRTASLPRHISLMLSYTPDIPECPHTPDISECLHTPDIPACLRALLSITPVCLHSPVPVHIPLQFHIPRQFPATPQHPVAGSRPHSRRGTRRGTSRGATRGARRAWSRLTFGFTPTRLGPETAEWGVPASGATQLLAVAAIGRTCHQPPSSADPW